MDKPNAPNAEPGFAALVAYTATRLHGYTPDGQIRIALDVRLGDVSVQAAQSSMRRLTEDYRI